MADGFEPFVGPRPFEVADQSIFFGREREAHELVSLVIAYPTLVIYAASGAGKTSLINARLIPRLESEDAEVMPVVRVGAPLPPDAAISDADNFFVTTTINQILDGESIPGDLPDLTIAEALAALPRAPDEFGDDRIRVLIFDQFEEVFTSRPERWSDREPFFRQIQQALHSDRTLRVVFVLREEFISALDDFQRIFDDQLRIRFPLKRLRHSQAIEAATGPLKSTSMQFAPGVAEKLIDDLSKIRVSDPQGKITEVSGEFIEPVHLQIVCQQLWDRYRLTETTITESDLADFGDVDAALASFYEDIIERAAIQTQFKADNLRSWTQEHLITSSGTRGLVHRGPTHTEGLPNQTIDILENEHLVHREDRSGSPWYELTHDRLISPIERSNARRDREISDRRWRFGMWIVGLSVAIAVLIVALNLKARVFSSDPTPGPTEIAQVQAILTSTAETAATTSVARAATAANNATATAMATLVTAEAQETTAASNATAAAAIASPTNTSTIIELTATIEAKRPETVSTPTASEPTASESTPVPTATEVVRSEAYEHAQQAFLQLAINPNRGLILAVDAYLNAKKMDDTDAENLALETITNYARLDFTDSELTTHGDWVWSAEFHPESDMPGAGLVLSASEDGTARITDLSDGNVEEIFASSAIRRARFSGDGAYVVVADASGTAAVYEQTDGIIGDQPVKVLTHIASSAGEDSSLWSAAFSSDDNYDYVATAGDDGYVKLWKWRDEQAEPILFRHRPGIAAVSDVAFNPTDEHLFVSVGGDGMVRGWDRRTPGEPKIRCEQVHTAWIWHVAFDPSGHYVATSSDDGTAVVWKIDWGNDTGSCVPVARLAGHSGSVSGVAFDPSNPDHVVTSGADGTFRIWNWDTETELKRTSAHNSWINTIAFDADGNTMLTASDDKTIKLWVRNSPPSDLITFAKDTLESEPLDGSVLPDLWRSGPRISLQRDDFVARGAYRRVDGTLYGRPAAHFYGTGSGFSSASLELALDKQPTTYVALELTGLDDELADSVQIDIQLACGNGEAPVSIGHWFGSSPFRNASSDLSDDTGWKPFVWIAWLERNTCGSTLKLTFGLPPSVQGQLGAPPWILLTDSTIYYD